MSKRASLLMVMGRSTLENRLGETPCATCGRADAPNFKGHIHPLSFLGQLSDIFENEMPWLMGECGNRKAAERMAKSERERGANA